MPGYTPKNYSLWLSRSGISVDAGVRRNEQMGFLIAGVSYTLSPIPLPCSLPPYPLPLLSLLHRLEMT